MANTIPFEHRYGILNTKPVTNDFPRTARISLIYLFNDLLSQSYIVSTESTSSWRQVLKELYRTARLIESDNNWLNTHDEMIWILDQMHWYQIFNFCERVYSRLLSNEKNNKTMEKIKEYFSNEINQILMEENIGYKFEKGEFERKGRPQTQKNIMKMGAVLNDSNLNEVRMHYNKALKFFTSPEADFNNCIKEALCGLELAVEICTKTEASRNFTNAIKELEGSDINKIPAPIAQGIIKIFAYRGSGKGISHSAPNGYRVTELEAELILNIVAAYITYIVDTFPILDDGLPF